MLPRATPDTETPALILERTTALVDYLMAVRAQLEKPARTVPTTDAFWQHDLPEHPDCQLGVSADGVSWLQVGLPAPPRRLKTPVEFVAHLADTPPYPAEPRLTGDEETIARLRPRFDQWREQDWRPWAEQAARTDRVRQLHRALFDLMHRVDMTAAITNWSGGTASSAPRSPATGCSTRWWRRRSPIEYERGPVGRPGRTAGAGPAADRRR